MSATNTAAQSKLHASLRLANGPEGQVLTAAVPSDINDKEFAAVGQAVLGLIRRLTGCNCLSGRIRVVVEDDFADVIRVDLNRGAVGGPGG
jgi:hypothetical protein